MNCHCGKPVSDHEAGRSLDRCVAEKLGVIKKHPNGMYSFNTPHISKPKYYDTEIIKFDAWLPHYSTLIEDAWGLVEKMDSRFQMYKLDPNIEEDWGVSSNAHDPIFAPTAPLAISRAFIAERG